MCTKEHSSFWRLGNQVYQCTQVHIWAQERQNTPADHFKAGPQAAANRQLAPQPPLDAVFGERGSLFLTPHLQERGGGNLQIPTLGEKEELETIRTLLASVSSPQQSKMTAFLEMRGRRIVLVFPSLLLILEGALPGCYAFNYVLLKAMIS